MSDHPDLLRRASARTTALAGVFAFSQCVHARANSWLIAANNIGSAYVQAYQRFKGALDDANKAVALGAQQYGSLLTVLLSGGGGGIEWVIEESKVMAKAAVPERFLVSVLLETMKASIGELFSAVGPMEAPSLPAVDITNPQVFQNDLKNRILAEEQFASEYLSGLGSAIEMTDENNAIWDKYNDKVQRGAYEKWRHGADLLVGYAGIPAVDFMAAEMERGMWAQWAPVLETDNPDGLEAMTGNPKVYAPIPPAVMARLTTLGIAPDFGNRGGWAAPGSASEQFVKWGRAYKPVNFLDMAKLTGQIERMINDSFDRAAKMMNLGLEQLFTFRVPLPSFVRSPWVVLTGRPAAKAAKPAARK